VDNQAKIRQSILVGMALVIASPSLAQIKIGAKVVSHGGRYVTFRLPEVAVSRADGRGYPVADRPAAGATRVSMSGTAVGCDGRRRHRCVSMQSVSAPRRGKLAISILASKPLEISDD